MNKKENNNLIILSTHTMCFCILGMMFLTIISSIGIFKSLINEYNQKMQYNEIFLILIAILVAPPIEEFIFRKLLFNFLRKRTKYYNLIQAILFGLAHGNPLQFIYTFLLGILLGNIKDRTGKVKISILNFLNKKFQPEIDKIIDKMDNIIRSLQFSKRLNVFFMPFIFYTLFP